MMCSTYRPVLNTVQWCVEAFLCLEAGMMFELVRLDRLIQNERSGLARDGVEVTA
jgi:hypothetical protein